MGKKKDDRVAAPAPVPKDGAALTVAIIPKKTVAILAIVSFVLATVLLLLGAFLPSLFNLPGPRYFLFVDASLSLAVFLWVLFPEKFEMTGIPGLDVLVKLTGPAALFFLTLYVLNAWYPKVSPEVLYAEIDYAGKKQISSLFIRFNGVETHNQIKPVVDNQQNVVGLIVQFIGGKAFDANIHFEGLTEPSKVTFTPGFEPVTIQLTHKK